MRLDQPRHGQLRRRGRVLDHLAGARRGEALLHQAAEHVVDALARQAGLARDLRRRVRIAANQRQVGLGLVRGEAEAGQLPDQLRMVRHAASASLRVRPVPGLARSEPHMVVSMRSVACRLRCPDGAFHPGAGAPRHTNRLASETSPYLLQHAHNPVDWHPWGPEALQRARASIGRSSCRSATPPATGATSWSASRSRTSRRPTR